MYKIAVVEDDTALRGALRETLEQAGYEVALPVDFLLSVEDFLKTVLDSRPDLIVLDLNLPGQNGINILKGLRVRGNEVPVVMITASTSEADEVLAMGMKADDYVTKPFRPQLLLLRIEAILRRTFGAAQNVELCGLTIDLSRGVITAAEGKAKRMTKNEMIVLVRLLKNRGKIVSRQDLMTDLWNNHEYINDNALTVTMSRLREKFNELGLSEVIETRKGLGYILK